jgi:catechol 2,3-dioxygenase-like lactoylglutathione lyase family enzyme
MSLGVRGQCPLLQVWDMQTSLHFWRDLLGFELVQCAHPADDTGWAWLRRGTDEIVPETQYELPDRPSEPASSAGRPTPIRSSVLAAPMWTPCARSFARGVEPSDPNVAPNGMKQMYLNDPDGFGVCLHWREAA